MTDQVKGVGVDGIVVGEVKKKVKKKRKSMTERVRMIRKRRFLKRYLERGSFYLASEYAGVTGTAVRKWLKKDPKFAECFVAVREAFVERMEEEADRRGTRGMRVMRYYQGRPIIDPRNGKPLVECEFSDALLMFRLKALKPGMYRDRLMEERESNVVKAYRGVDVERV